MLNPIGPNNLRVLNHGQLFTYQNGNHNGFCTFDTFPHAFRAFFKVVHTYMTLEGCKTISDIINRFAPAGDNNNTERYISTVCSYVGIGAKDEFTPTYDNLRNLCYGSAVQENGLDNVKAGIPSTDFAAGLDLFIADVPGWVVTD